ncbi:phosphate ABC transporter substrate-binding protein [Spiroplasma endosymbiont of Anurida maritima]|uniref:phosphate ABC transporter substrate-binding protein n=1 Tax=Spiroplasma endosymbiont of Anurida maritima TaxID=2967972 RepID=UPI0036D3A4AE
MSKKNKDTNVDDKKLNSQDDISDETYLNGGKQTFVSKFWLFVASKRIMITLSMFVILVASIIIWTVSTSSNVIIAGGSTSVAPAMNEVTAQYKKDKGVDVLYNSLGSSAAFVGVRNNSYAFGYLSKDVHSTPKENDNGTSASALWNNEQILRYVFARDFIVLAANIPSGCKLKPAQNYLEFGLMGKSGSKDGSELLQKIYAGEVNWAEAFPEQLDCDDEAETDFHTLTRESGSGTRSFFESNVLGTKDYSTDEVTTSNGGMTGKITDTEGSIGYVSFPFLKDIVAKLGETAIIAVGKTEETKSELPYINIGDETNPLYEFNPSYTLTRPFTGVINTNYKAAFRTILEFVGWMIDPEPYSSYMADPEANPLTENDAAYWYAKLGLQPLTFDDPYFSKYNNNTEFAKSGIQTDNEPVAWNMDQNYRGLWDFIVEETGLYADVDYSAYAYKG